jgi:hypothetical protein
MLRLYQRLTLASRKIASSAAAENQAMLPWPCDGGAGAASHLEQRLGEAVAPAGCHPGNARRFRVEHGGAEADQRGGEEDGGIAVGDGEKQQAYQAAQHADWQRIGLRATIGDQPDDRLEHRGGELEGERDQPDLAEVEMVGVLQDRIHRRHERLVHVVQQVAH